MKILIACASLALASCSAKGSFDDTSVPDGGGKPDTGGNGSDGGTDDADIDTGPADTGPPPCVYPQGPYGYTGMAGSWLGAIVPPSFQWQGYLKGSSQIQTLSANDLYDCDGRNGINAILFDMSALWCGPCQQEAQQVPTWMQTWGPIGVVFVNLIVEDASHNKATTAAAQTWLNQFNLGSAGDVVADPNFSFAHGGTNGLPTNVLVDPRTMKVTKVVEGYTGQQDPSVTALANKNK
jgi:thiol-disulfide isomerase/thioredoxin